MDDDWGYPYDAGNPHIIFDTIYWGLPLLEYPHVYMGSSASLPFEIFSGDVRSRDSALASHLVRKKVLHRDVTEI